IEGVMRKAPRRPAWRPIWLEAPMQKERPKSNVSLTRAAAITIFQILATAMPRARIRATILVSIPVVSILVAAILVAATAAAAVVVTAAAAMVVTAVAAMVVTAGATKQILTHM